VEVAMRRFTEPERAEVWKCRGAGEPTRVIARRLGRNASSIRRVFENAGGVRPAPPTCGASRAALELEYRLEADRYRLRQPGDAA
jgi:hypothetical protein